MVKIAVCDDIKCFVENIKNHILNYSCDSNTNLGVDCYFDGNNMIEQDKIKKYDIVFLDVEMGKTSGIDIGYKLKKQNPNLILVYVSAHIDYSLIGYKVKAFSYILKSNFDAIFYDEMNGILEEILHLKKKFTFSIDSEVISIPYRDIVYLMSDARKINLVDKNHKTYTFYGKLNDFVNELNFKEFLRVQQSYFVNLRYATTIRDYEVHLTDGTRITTTRNNYKLLKEKYAQIKGNM